MTKCQRIESRIWCGQVCEIPPAAIRQSLPRSGSAPCQLAALSYLCPFPVTFAVTDISDLTLPSPSQSIHRRFFSSSHGECSSCATCAPRTLNARQSHTVDIPQEIKTALRKFRFARRDQGHAAIVIKINKAKLVMEEVEQFDNISIEDLAEGAFEASMLPRWRGLTPPPSLQNFRRTVLDTLSSPTSFTTRTGERRTPSS